MIHRDNKATHFCDSSTKVSSQAEMTCTCHAYSSRRCQYRRARTIQSLLPHARSGIVLVNIINMVTRTRPRVCVLIQMGASCRLVMGQIIEEMLKHGKYGCSALLRWP